MVGRWLFAKEAVELNEMDVVSIEPNKIIFIDSVVFSPLYCWSHAFKLAERKT